MSHPFAGAARAVPEPQLRFLRAIADRVAVERVAEVYLFPPMRQGHVESGVGVVAVLPEPEAAEEGVEAAPDDGAASADSLGGEQLDALDHVHAADGVTASRVEAPDEDRDAREADAATGALVDSSATSETATAHAAAAEAAEPDRATSSADATSPDDATSSGATVPSADTGAAGAPPRQHDGADAPPNADHFAADRPRTPRTGGRRSTIFSARYRLTLKGPDRGKWEVDVRAEADAPLITVDAVIRGIQRRAPGEADAERLTGDAFRELVAPPA